ncbi:beta-ketoacyl-ACP synthase III [Pectinatus haikarae]|uniref:Beta-ketoacyl-[acyl-carrier-protein] synthase III n=1 Tax=Pectinatus haikarae TaxID=349096 RepID=A0ABT9Y6M0_9FIRM|nr:beta-ketoacyl-ACP synthase III [Pectinatus haikarae]MDQ0202799.1 3-oxoacyl-[acyl-carrier-protein] synthase-3 [Pectinatus haikarae]
MTGKNSAGILGTGFCLPEDKLTNFDLEKMVNTNDDWIVGRTGIHERRIASEGTATSNIAFKAAQMALKDAGVEPDELDLIIVATISSDRIIPSTACVLQDMLGASHAGAFDLTAACSGFIYASSVAAQFIQSGVYKKILVIGAETLSRFIDWQDRNTCVIFGDGAGAAVYGRVDDGYGMLSFDLGADGSGGDSLDIPGGGSLHPASAATVKDRLHYLHMNGKEVFRFSVKIMGETVLNSLERANLQKENIDWLIPHQANIRIIQTGAKRLQLSMDKVIVNIGKYGNTSAASIPIALAEAAHNKTFKKGDILAFSGFGAGLTWASCIMKWAKEE